MERVSITSSFLSHNVVAIIKAHPFPSTKNSIVEGKIKGRIKIDCKPSPPPRASNPPTFPRFSGGNNKLSHRVAAVPRDPRSMGH